MSPFSPVIDVKWGFCLCADRVQRSVVKSPKIQVLSTKARKFLLKSQCLRPKFDGKSNKYRPFQVLQLYNNVNIFDDRLNFRSRLSK